MKLNRMTQLELAKAIQSFVKSHTPEIELNLQSYALLHTREGYGLWPEGDVGLYLASRSKYNLLQTDFGGIETELVDGFRRSSGDRGDAGSAWMEDGGARISFWLSKKRWSLGLWKDLISACRQYCRSN